MARHSNRYKREQAPAAGSGLGRWLRRYLVTAGVLAHLAAPALVYVYFQKSEKSVGESYAAVVSAVKNHARVGVTAVAESRRDYADVKMKERIRSTHPRVMLPQLSNWKGGKESEFMRKRRLDQRLAKVPITDPCKTNTGYNMIACWYTTGKDEAAQKAVKLMKVRKVVKPNVQGEYGNGWTFAIAYDLLFNYPGFSAADKRYFVSVIEQSLKDTIKVLESDGPSLWHGRSVLAANAWIMAMTLDADTPQRRLLIRKAHGHFMSIVEAMEFSEAWPEGYNYWINTRALRLMIAMAGYLNATKDGEAAPRIKAVMTRIGLWTIYATRPDNRIQGIGDEGPRVDLKDESQRIIDLIAGATRNPVFAAFSRYIGHLHGTQSYAWSYRWSVPFVSDGDMASTTIGKNYSSLYDVAKDLPLAREFGPGSMGLAYIRSGWKSTDTFISFRAGHSLVHHGHYDAGGFTLFKNAPLAINSSTYGDFWAPNRLYYSIRSVAKNSMLIMRPGEDIQPNERFLENVVDGGQRLVMPSGSTVLNLDHWRKNLDAGAHYRGGEITKTDFDQQSYAYLFSDIAPAYDTPEFDSQGEKGRVSRLTRELFYLRDEDRLIVHDDVRTVDAGFQKKWLLHTINKPMVEHETVLKGDTSGGILQTRDQLAIVRNGDTEMDVQTVYPKDAVAHLVGGDGYEYYVEMDGDDSVLDGKNYLQGANPKDWFDNGKWRIEIEPGRKRLQDHFLVALSPRKKGVRPDRVRAVELAGTGSHALETPRSIVIFAGSKARSPLRFKLPGRQTRVFVAGVPGGRKIHLDAIGIKSEAVSSKAGVVNLELFAPPQATVKITW